MKNFSAVLVVLFLFSAVSYADDKGPVTFYQPFDSFDFTADDFVHETGVLTPEERGLKLVDGRFGKALHHTLGPQFNTDMSTFDLDMITALVVDYFYVKTGMLYKQPFFWKQ